MINIRTDCLRRKPDFEKSMIIMSGTEKFGPKLNVDHQHHQQKPNFDHEETA